MLPSDALIVRSSSDLHPSSFIASRSLHCRWLLESSVEIMEEKRHIYHECRGLMKYETPGKDNLFLCRKPPDRVPTINPILLPLHKFAVRFVHVGMRHASDTGGHDWARRYAGYNSWASQGGTTIFGEGNGKPCVYVHPLTITMNSLPVISMLSLYRDVEVSQKAAEVAFEPWVQYWEQSGFGASLSRSQGLSRTFQPKWWICFDHF